MKANLAQREPQVLKEWEQEDIYRKILESRKSRKPFILHDGPPYANGNIHIGHALNKILKDMIVKFKTMQGYYSPYVPGWDCHGLPIEHQVMKKLGPKAKTLGLDVIRKECRKYAQKFIDIQKKDFQRLGIFGDFENPYKTMSRDYEADIVDALADLLEKNYVYKGMKPVYWCGHCNTALADAEIEYHNHTSPSIYVKFPVEENPFGVDGNVSVIIWTTTPWTLPANVAISFHPDYPYSLIQSGNEYYIIAKDLVKTVAETAGFQYEEVKIVSKEELSGLKIRHPFIEERMVKPVFGTHVTLDAGTGAVHTAPGHGVEDYEVGLEYNLDVIAPVDHEARFTMEVKEWSGLQVFEANPKIIEKLKQENKLLYTEDMEHSYPHCWRCKNPVIFRATPQWFISVSHENLRNRAIEEAEKNIKWIPKWGQKRMTSMLENRPDWCISRQRSWGVPIPAVYCSDCGETMLTPEMMRKVSDIVRKEGLDIWFVQPVSHFFGTDFKCSKCGSQNLKKEGDILDVWFDSGVSWHAVLKQRNMPEADMYLEGSDQHRGWFQSSFITSMGIQGKAPYREVLTHGFILDEHGRAMSKSVGNVVAPEEIIKTYGADILRLWVTTQDYSEDLRIGDNVIKQTADAYRKIRNTFRFLLGNLSDFDYEKDAVAYEELNPIDQWAVTRLKKLVGEVTEDYNEYRFSNVFRKIYNFTNLDLSSFYFDILKDLLYTYKRDGKDRRSAQTVLNRILDALTRLIAPVLVFTSEEVWKQIAPEGGSIHVQEMPKAEDYADFSETFREMEALIPLRDEVLKAMEIARSEKKIGASLEAKVQIELKNPDLESILKKYADFMPVYFIASRVLLEKADSGAVFYEGDQAKIGIVQAEGEKCPRCWKYKKDIGQSSEHPELCAQCAEAVE
jgi:isoleucyl-tRNA synthetase